MSWQRIVGAIALDALKGWWQRRQAKKLELEKAEEEKPSENSIG